MPMLLDSILRLCRKMGRAPEEAPTQFACMGYAYRLLEWPLLPPRWRTAAVLRALSRMSIGPVTHGWFLARCSLPRTDAECLLEWLVETGALKRVDLAGRP